MDDLMTAAEVAKLLGVTVEHLVDRKRHAKGFPPAYKPGRQLVWKREDIERWFESTIQRTAAA